MVSAKMYFFLQIVTILGHTPYTIHHEPFLYLIRRNPVESLKVEREERSKATPPFDVTQGHEPVDWQMIPSWGSGTYISNGQGYLSMLA